MRVIKSLAVLIAGPEGGAHWYKIGEKVNGLTIANIKNTGSEFEDSIHSEYHIRDEKNGLVVVIENCPVLVEYTEEAGDHA
jgi:hypothetical protein